MKDAQLFIHSANFHAKAMSRFFAVLLSLVVASQLHGQCQRLGSLDYIHGNQIRTATSTAGDMFWDRYDSQFLVPFSGPNSPASIFAAALWIGGYDQDNELHLSAETYVNSTRFEFAPGPLINGEVSGDICFRWDRHWNVLREEILTHLADFEDNNFIDAPGKAIYGWPGKNNPHFESINGFPLPNDSLLSAPFIDIDGNGDYTPDGGDYPHPENIDPSTIPSEMQWCVFNDLAPDPFTSGNGDGIPLEFEFQLTTYAFSCDNNDILDHTVFTSYRIINRSENTYDSLRMGFWTDPDLGCYTDDYIGCDPSRNSFFSYNEDSIDGYIGSTCFGTESVLPTYGSHPPVQSSTFLNTGMTSFTYYNSGLIDGPLGMSPPQVEYEFFNLMNSRFTDGTPITVGGSGYLSGTEVTSHVFPDDPLDSTKWSMQSEELYFGDRRFTAASQLGTVHPGEAFTIDMAHTFHLDTSLNREENIARMYPRLDSLISMYNGQFVQACDYPTQPCFDDCIWPGDANHNGIVNTDDYLTILTNSGPSGDKRPGPLAWHPLPADDWDSYTFYGTNNKHCDTNGDGAITASDLEIVDYYFGNTVKAMPAVQEARYGNNFILTIRDNIIDANNIFPPIDIDIKFTPQFDMDISGIAFQLSFDPYYFALAPPIQVDYQSIITDSIKFYREIATEGAMTFVDALYNNKSFRPTAKDIVNLVGYHSRPEVTNGSDTTYFEITKARAVLPTGEIISIPGQRLPLIFIDKAPPVQIPVSDYKNEINIYPNPNSGHFTLEVTDEFLGEEYQIISLQGKEVSGGIINDIQNKIQLNPGMYFVKILTPGYPVTKRVVVID